MVNFENELNITIRSISSPGRYVSVFFFFCPPSFGRQQANHPLIFGKTLCRYGKWLRSISTWYFIDASPKITMLSSVKRVYRMLWIRCVSFLGKSIDRHLVNLRCSIFGPALRRVKWTKSKRRTIEMTSFLVLVVLISSGYFNKLPLSLIKWDL